MKRKMEKPLQAKVTTTAVNWNNYIKNWDNYIKISAETNDLYLFDLQYLPTRCLTPSHFLSLQAYLNTHAEITTIKISNASNQSIVLLSAVIADNTTLIAVNLRYNKLGAEGAKHSLEAILKNPICTTIKLDRNCIDKKLLSKINQQLNINKQRKVRLPITTKNLCMALRYGSLFAKKTVVIPKGLRKHLIKKIVGHAYELTPHQVNQLLSRPK